MHEALTHIYNQASKTDLSARANVVHEVIRAAASGKAYTPNDEGCASRRLPELTNFGQGRVPAIGIYGNQATEVCLALSAVESGESIGSPEGAIDSLFSPLSASSGPTPLPGQPRHQEMFIDPAKYLQENPPTTLPSHDPSVVALLSKCVRYYFSHELPNHICFSFYIGYRARANGWHRYRLVLTHPLEKSGCLFCATMFELRCLFCEPAHTRTLIRSLRASTIPKVVVTTIFSLGYRIILLNDAYVYFAAYILIWSDQNYELMARYDWDGWKA